MTHSYEDQLAKVQGLRRPAGEDDRLIDWCVEDGVIGLARTAMGRIEIFLEGEKVDARFRRVREALEYQRWYRAGGDELLANRILLPAAGHFEQVAAFLCTELLRNGATRDLAGAFARTEPLIELAIDDLMIAEETYLGLCGELLLLEALVRGARDDLVGEVITSWTGHRETSRDFQFGWAGVEVKTTTGSSSSHLFKGVKQLERGNGVDGAEEESFMLASLGLEWTDSDDDANTTALPVLVDGIVECSIAALGKAADAVVDEFLRHISDYGPAASLGYDHRTMSRIARFGRRFRVRFVRCYDMDDDAIRLLTTDDMRRRPFIDADSLRLRVNLPDRVTGDINPVVGLSNCARGILQRGMPG